MGHEPKLSTKLDSVENFIEKMKTLRMTAEEALSKAAADMKHFYDENRGKTPVYKIGEKVWLEATNIDTGQPMKKLDNRRLGPYEIQKVLSNNTYELKLPKSMKIHPVFHVVKLRPHVANTIPERVQKSPPPPVIHNEVEEYKVEEILN